MAPENRKTAEEAFHELETQLAALRTTSRALRERRPSLTENFLHPGRRAKEEAEFGGALVSALKEFGASIRTALAHQESKLSDLELKLSDLERQLSEVRSEQSDLGRLRERQEQLEKRIGEQADSITKSIEAATQSSSTQLRQEIARIEQLAREQAVEQAAEQAAKAEQLAGGQKDLANEFRERIQHLLDEQRVAIRQLALKASEDAVLSDRARRATELKLEELAKRIPPAPPA